MNNIPADLNTFLSALQTELDYPIQLMQIDVQDKSGRLEWVVRTIYKNSMQQWSVWLNPSGQWGWEPTKSFQSNFGF
jgi:hypothetical protein